MNFYLQWRTVKPGACSISVSGLHKVGQQQSALQLGSFTSYSAPQEFATEPRHQRAETARNRSNTRLDRPKAVSEPEKHNVEWF